MILSQITAAHYENDYIYLANEWNITVDCTSNMFPTIRNKVNGNICFLANF